MGEMGSRDSGAHGCGSISHWTQGRPPQEAQVWNSCDAIASTDKVSLRTPPKPMNSSLTQQIIDDSSLAATLAANNDRHLFFQAPQGAIRRMIYTATEAQWIADPDPITIPDAKMLTPMAISTPSENQVTFSLPQEKLTEPTFYLSLGFIISLRAIN